MPSRPRAPLTRVAVAASTTVLSALLGAALLAPVQPALAQEARAAGPPLQVARPADASRVVQVGGGERVAVTPVDGSAMTLLTALPDADGVVPGVMTQRTDAGTTVQTTDPASRPTLIQGRDEPQAVGVVRAPVALHFDVTGRDGRPADAHINVFDLETGAIWTRQIYAGEHPSDQCTRETFALTTCAKVPRGRYSVIAVVSTLPAQPLRIGVGRTMQNVSIVGSPETTVDGARTFTLDARDAKRVNVRTPGHRTTVPDQGMLQIGYDRTAANGAGVHFNMWPNVLLDQHFYLQPTAPVSTGTFQTRTRIRLEAPDIELSAPSLRRLHPEYVDAFWFADLSSEFPVVDGSSDVRVVRVGHATAADLEGVSLDGALALVTHSDDLSLAEQSNRAAEHGASVVVIRNDGPGDIADPGGVGVRLQVPTIRLDRAEGRALARLPKKARVTVRGEAASPYLYDLNLKHEGEIPDDPSFIARTDELATQVHDVHGQPTLDSTFSEISSTFEPGETVSISRSLPFRGGARTRTEYRVPDPDTRWIFTLVTPELVSSDLFPHPEQQEMGLGSKEFHVYTAPGQTELSVAAAPVVSGFHPVFPVRRSGDAIKMNLRPFIDPEGNNGAGWPQGGFTTHLQVLVDGALLGETDYATSVTAQLPPGPSTVALRYTTDNPQPWAELSTHTDTTWTFPTDTVAAGQEVVQPVLVAGYDVDVDLRNRVVPQPGTPVSFELRLAQPDGATPAPVQTVSVDASYDDGTGWDEATVVENGDGWRVTLPPGAGYVSLRLHAEDIAGSAVDQTVIRAFDVVG